MKGRERNRRGEGMKRREEQEEKIKGRENR